GSPGRTIGSRSRGRVGLVLLFVAGGAGKPLLTWSALPDSSRIRTQVQVVGPLLGENRPRSEGVFRGGGCEDERIPRRTPQSTFGAVFTWCGLTLLRKLPFA